MPNKTQSKPKTTWLIPGIILLVVALVAAIFIFGQAPQSTTLPTTVNVTDAIERFEKGAFLLDVRQPEEWVEGHVEGAVLIPLGELETRIKEIPVDQDVLIICRSGNRSGQARDLLRAAGLERTTSISGGINAWIAAGLPIVTGN